jgi:hypothetical protein
MGVHPKMFLPPNCALCLLTLAMMPRDPPAVSPSIRPTSGIAAWAAGGMDCAAPSDTTVAVSSYAWLITVMATPACDVEASVCGAAPTTEGTIGIIGGFIRSNVGGGVTSAAVCSVTPEGASLAPVPA